jgi:hypothetical protein
MDLADNLERQLEAAVLSNLGSPVNLDVQRTLVGPESLRQLPGGLNPYGHAQWVVRYALRR